MEPHHKLYTAYAEKHIDTCIQSETEIATYAYLDRAVKHIDTCIQSETEITTVSYLDRVVIRCLDVVVSWVETVDNHLATKQSTFRFSNRRQPECETRLASSVQWSTEGKHHRQQIDLWKKVQDQGLGAPCREKPLEKSGLEPAAPNRLADRKHCALSTHPNPHLKNWSLTGQLQTSRFLFFSFLGR